MTARSGTGVGMRTWTRPERWLSEVSRVMVVTVLSTTVALVLGWVGVIPRPESVTSLAADLLVVWLILYFSCYTLLTLVAFHLAPAKRVEVWARTEERGSWMQRYVYGTAPGPGMSISVGVAALLVTVLWLPGTVTLSSAFDDGARMALGVLLVVTAWVTVAVSFTVAYLAEDLQSGGEALGFPDGSRDVTRPLTDYLYLAVAVSSTFGTTDVELRTTPVRRTATVHTLVAFVFNTVVLAVVVSVLA